VPRDRVQRALYSGNTYLGEEAVEMGLIDELVDPSLLEGRAMDMARKMAELPPRTFAITKRQLRHIAIERMHQTAAMDEEVKRVWCSPETHAHIREYLAKTVKK
jgi:enoyl-CoA hydratase